MNCKLISLLTVVAFVVSCKGPVMQEQGPRPVKIAKVAALDMIEKTYSGAVSPDQFSDLAFKMSGPLITLNVEEGQRVKTGQVVAEIDPLDYRLDFEAKKSSFLTAESQLTRAKKLLGKQAISHQDYESTEAAYSNAKAAYENAQNQLKETKLRAPFDGFIQKKYVENYQKVQAGQGIVCLINPNKLLVRFTLPENNMDNLASDPLIFVEFENYKGKLFKAKLKEYVEASPDGSGVPVSLYINDPDFNLSDYQVAVGFSCRVVLNIKQAGFSGYSVIPLSAIISDPVSGKLFVFVYGEGKVRQREVKEGGIMEKDLVIITEGLKNGEEVVVAGTTRLVDGKEVKVLTE